MSEDYSREELLRLIHDLEPNYKIEGLRRRPTNQLYYIYRYLLDRKVPKRRTAQKVVAVEEVEVTYEREEFLSQEEIEIMYPDGGGPISKSQTKIVNLDEGDGFGFHHKKPY